MGQPQFDVKAYHFKKLPRPPSRARLLDFHHEADWQIGQIDLGKALEQGLHIHWVVLKQKDRMIAIARIEVAPPAFAFASNVVVRKADRGKGIGRWFVGHIECYSQSHGVARVIVHPDAAARLFWLNCGYQPDPKAPDFLKKDLWSSRSS